MFNLGKLFVSFEAKTKPYDDALAAAVRDAQATARAVGEATSFSLGTPEVAGGGGFREAEASAGDAAAQMRAQFASALAPLTTIGARLGDQFNRVGGTVVALARKIDGRLRFEASTEAARKLDESISKALEHAARDGVDALSRVEKATLRLGPAALKSLNAYNGFKKFRSAAGDLFGGDIGKKTLDKGSYADLARGADGAARFRLSLGGIPQAANAATGSVKRLGAEVALALGAFGLVFKGVQFLKSGVTGAADLAESVSKTGEVFGKSAGEVTAQAERMAKAYGLPKQASLDAAASIGLIAEAAGQSDAAAAKMANELSKLGADASSFYNVPLDESLQKIRSGLVGESEPLRAFGVLLSEDAVKAEALSLKLVKSGKELDEQTKVMARASLIKKGLATADGDLEKTAGSASNQFRKFSGYVENLGTSIGAALLPAVTKGTALLTGLAEWASGAFEANKGSVESFTASLSAGFDNVAAGVHGVMEIAREVPAAWEAAFGSGPSEMVTGLAAAVADGFELAGVVLRNLPAFAEVAGLKIVEVLTNLGEHARAVADNFAQYGAYLGENWYQLVTDAFDATLAFLKNYWSNVAELARAGYEAMKGNGFHPNFTPMLEGFEATAAKLPEVIQPHLTSLQGEIDRKLEEIGKAEAEHAAKIARDAAKKAEPAPARKPRTPPAKNPEKPKDPEELGFAEFARKLGSKQFQDKDKAVTDNTKALADNLAAVEKNTEALGKKAPAVFA